MNSRPDDLEPFVYEASTVKDYPLTKQQQALWIEHCLYPDNTSYNTCVKLKLAGNLDAMRFRQSSQLVISFFDSLKVHFVVEGGVPFQRTDSSAQYLPEFIDISEGAIEETPEKALEAKELLSDQLNIPIDLKEFPIMRGMLIKTAQEVHYYIGMVPHIISDGRAAILYLESLSIAYNSGGKGLIEAYGESRKNWETYYQEGLDQLDEVFAVEAKKHWQQRLKDATHYFDYSYGKQMVTAGSKQGERVYFDLSVEISQRLKAHSKANKTTLFNVFVCVFSIFVQRYYGLLDVLIGYPVNIRPQGYKNFFAFFVNIVPLRVNMHGNPSYEELLKRVHNTRKEDKKFQKYPALDIVTGIREMVPDFDGRVFNLSMAQTVSRLFDLQLDGIDSEPLDTEYYDVNDDFSLSYELIEGRIGLWFEYRKALFNRNFIDQSMQHIESIIRQCLDYPERPVKQFTLLDEQQKRRIIDEFSSPAIGFQAVGKSVRTSEEDTMTSLFENQVQKTPEAIAIIDEQNSTGQRSVSYRQLNQKANQLANIILRHSQGNSVPIGVSLERGSNLIVSLLAILKAGCYYIPIPPDYPQKRINYIFEESNATILILQSSGDKSKSVDGYKNDGLPPMHLYLDDIVDDLRAQDDKNLPGRIQPNDRAYVIYTSGSTGMPKGVALQHKSVTPRLTWLSQHFALSNNDKMLQNTDYSFDVSVAEIFWPLTCGVALVVADQKMNRDPGYLLSLIDQYQITASCMVPSLLNILLDADKNNQLASMNHVLSAGEPLPDSVVAKYFQQSTGRLYNFYGPTEAAIYSSFTECKRNSVKPVTIGKPLGSTKIYILDENLNLQPIGVVGELYIGGVGVAEGYLGDNELTNRHFINDPFTPQTSITDTFSKLYRTGDLARYDFDGDIEFIGRKDKQVKIRGFRVELGEIENTIIQCPDVSDAVVIDHRRDNNHLQLVAYLAVRDQSQIENSNDLDVSRNNEHIINQARQQICSALPGFMMPSLFVVLDQIPRSLSGKLERSALPDPGRSLTMNLDFRCAETVMEKRIASIWSSLLGIESNRLDINTSFFDLGGDSLMAVQFVSLAEEHSLLFDMSDIFELRSISELATVARSGRAATIEQKEISGTYPLLPRQAKFFADDFIEPDYWNRTFCFDVNHELDQQAFVKSLDAILRHHDNLRVKFVQQISGEWQQEIQPEVLASGLFTSYDLASLTESEKNESITLNVNNHHKKINLSQAPLIQVVHFKIDENIGKLAILFHHLMLDMVSSRLIFEDLVRAYESYRAGVSVIFPAKSNSVKSWSTQLQASLKESEFVDALAYWGKLPESAQPSLPIEEFTTNSANVDSELRNIEASGKVKLFLLNKDLTRRLIKDSPSKISINVQDLLLANLFKIISNWTRGNSMTVNLCGHGRQLDSSIFNLSRTVGWLNTVYPVHLTTPFLQEPSITKKFLFEVQRQIEEVPTNDMDYNLLRYVAKDPEILRHESPQIFFNYVGQLDTYIPPGAPFAPTADLPGIVGVSGTNHLCYELYFEAGVINGQLTFRLTYSENSFSQATVDYLAEEFLGALKQTLICLG